MVGGRFSRARVARVASSTGAAGIKRSRRRRRSRRTGFRSNNELTVCLFLRFLCFLQALPKLLLASIECGCAIRGNVCKGWGFLLRGGCSERAEEKGGVGGRGDKTSREHCKKEQTEVIRARGRKALEALPEQEWTCACLGE